MLEEIPTLKTDLQTEDFVDQANRSEGDLTKFKVTKLEFATKDQRLNMRLPLNLLKVVKKKAKVLLYQRYTRAAMKKAVGEK